jgi:hypothetical protein
MFDHFCFKIEHERQDRFNATTLTFLTACPFGVVAQTAKVLVAERNKIVIIF